MRPAPAPRSRDSSVSGAYVRWAYPSNRAHAAGSTAQPSTGAVSCSASRRPGSTVTAASDANRDPAPSGCTDRNPKRCVAPGRNQRGSGPDGHARQRRAEEQRLSNPTEFRGPRCEPLREVGTHRANHDRVERERVVRPRQPDVRRGNVGVDAPITPVEKIGQHFWSGEPMIGKPPGSPTGVRRQPPRHADTSRRFLCHRVDLVRRQNQRAHRFLSAASGG